MAAEEKKKPEPKKKTLTPVGRLKRELAEKEDRIASLETRLAGMTPHLLDDERMRAQKIFEGALEAHQQALSGELGPWAIIAVAMREIEERSLRVVDLPPQAMDQPTDKPPGVTSIDPSSKPGSMPFANFFLFETRGGGHQVRADGGGCSYRSQVHPTREAALSESREVLEDMADIALPEEESIVRVMMQVSTGPRGQLAVTSIWAENAHSFARANDASCFVTEAFRMKGAHFNEMYEECAMSLALQLMAYRREFAKRTLLLCDAPFQKMVYAKMCKIGTPAFELKDL